ncbi:phenylalanine--tRNA ligase subunit beta [Buchnera aphidicola]|jgi:phenylalanyl-tRNA synthetase beta chain|uniref:Phenylalanine--tRNA ligase beta subunit n=1 Tax=Buchnera aphidicola subsp. Schizaphis graminum (strain Sg) TaxID=198804 RepID=SYFB_BUCAP|nr:phenylalanine--tRNA ligase subunit beta [Buchnera aphidicola]P59057.1 RecName: Full=Phenylalanine--tRNA ligase beta subunit; AltName: Full=Phenylalanyl-tRNA synthetase beta subunit; Short=PheRS [Buchnera aphidicola str. Sg (Schizaphis graminum)]AAM67690.1 phenylalanyl-tRNA synthetase beta chain [Buchnera aphidicola str. Sg (Schizaphis graminum)]
MKFNENWLREWINPKITSVSLRNQIVESGIEIESIHEFNPIFDGFLVGKIVECINPCKGNNLKILKVDVGYKKLLNIVCGASNCRNNIKVVVATIDSILPNGSKIKIKKIKEKLSEGMICSFFELGLFNFCKDIIELPEDIPIGKKINDLFLLKKDTFIKVAVTPNRPDGLSILGIARNIAAINNLKKIRLKKRILPTTIEDQFPITINTEKQSVNYFGRIIQNVNLNVDTPFWMKKKLFFCDLLSDNIIENILNYILIEIGQPLNILNADKIDDVIEIRMAIKKEFLILKNDTRIVLDKDILVFSDKTKILFIPGNINNSDLEPNKNTKNIFLTSYLVDKKSILNILKKIDSNNILDYYSHGVDASLQKYAIEYATYLIVKICGGKIGPINTKKSNFNSLSCSNKIKLYHQNFNKCIDSFVDSSIISNILLCLEYKVNFHKKYWYVFPPSWRFDILIEEDVIGDILRIYNYNNIPLTPLKQNYYFNSKNKDLKSPLLDEAAVLLINRGYYEIITYSFINPSLQDDIIPNNNQILISNPISKDFSSMRLSLWPGLLKTVSYNKNRQQESMRFFERGLCFSIDESQILGIRQEMFLGGVISGFYSKENWFSVRRKVDFYDLKGDLESLLEVICGLNKFEIRHQNILGLHPEQSAKIYLDNKYIGSLGKIHPKIEKKLNLYNSTFLFELSLNYISKLKFYNTEEISKYPTSRRDIAILVSKDIPFLDIITVCKDFFVNKKVEINLFDVYSCKEFDNRKKSLGISFVFQNFKKNLKENEVNLMLHDCIKILKKKFQVVLRK